MAPVEKEMVLMIVMKVKSDFPIRCINEQSEPLPFGNFATRDNRWELKSCHFSACDYRECSYHGRSQNFRQWGFEGRSARKANGPGLPIKGAPEK